MEEYRNIKKSKIIAILIAYNAEKTLKEFYESLPKEYFDEIILVDDCSSDNTFGLSKKLGIKSYRNRINLGYGGNLKRAICIALQLGADVVVDIHPDGEYKTSAIPEALKKVKSGSQFVLGNRFTTLFGPVRSGMFIWKLLPIKILNWIDKVVLGIDLGDYHQGFRVYTRAMMEKINFLQNSNDYLFSFEIIAQAIFNKVKISEVPVETVYKGKKRGIRLQHALKYSIASFLILWQFILAKHGRPSKIFEKPKEDLNKAVF
ncbi:hypothetical protein A2964_01650 [Candidatus Daviesbacteria bacterium RIFCSPLOWO2_01_FULL_40_27]|nr:MAG: hypothetical protein A2964_01650 [Candidatus Daviesbacteria bacterium RIFCSPLOWO2_01_FULL_40_27]